MNNDHYDKEYFDWQKNVGMFGGIANKIKFENYINVHDTVIDFGCGGGFLLYNLNCKRKIGIEVNPIAHECAKKIDIDVVGSIEELPDECADVIISNHALEHVPNPFETLVKLKGKLKIGKRIIFVVPSDNVRLPFTENDLHQHLYSWSLSNLGNLFARAGFKVEKVEEFCHRWPPYYQQISKWFGFNIFHKICRIYYFMKRDRMQLRIFAIKNSK